MKYIYCCLFSLLFLTVQEARSQDYMLVPQHFYLHKGDELKVHLFSANQFVIQDRLNFDPAKIDKFNISAGSKKSDKDIATKSSDTIATVTAEKDGLNMITMTRKPVIDDVEREDFTRELDDEGLTQYSEKVKNGSKDIFRERFTWYLKTLVKVDKESANDFNKSQDQDYEIILKDNPYKGNYGDDIIGVVNFKGKPVVNAVVVFYIKSHGGNVFVQKLSTDKAGQIYFKLSREGVYMLRSLHMEPSKDKSADYDTWLTTYTFAFVSSNEMPNTYKEFGFGNIH